MDFVVIFFFLCFIFNEYILFLKGEKFMLIDNNEVLLREIIFIRIKRVGKRLRSIFNV